MATTLGSIYVMRHSVGTRTTIPHGKNAALNVMADNYLILPTKLQDWYDMYTREDRARCREISDWASAFTAAVARGDASLPDKRGVLRSRHDLTVMQKVLLRLIRAGARGMTNDEIRVVTGLRTNGVSGALSHLHEAGVIARLEARR